MSFAEFFTTLKEARFGFGVIRDAVINLYYAITANPDIQPIWNWIMNTVKPVFSFVILVLILLGISGTFFGQKMMSVFKFAFFFVVGFTLGIHLLAPVIPEVVKIPAWVVGLVVALVAAVLYRFLYYALYAVSIGYSSYILFYYGFFLIKNPVYTTTRALVCTLLALGVVAVAFALRKYVEMVGTAAIGAWIITMLFIWYVYNFTKWPMFAGREWLGVAIVTVIIGLCGAFAQFKTRKRY